MKKKAKYSIVLFCNKKKVRTLYTCYKRTTLYEHWREYKTAKKPPYVKLIGAKRNQNLIWELALIFPNNRWVHSVYVKDSLGRTIEAKIENDKFRIKEIIPYWKEELIYDFDKKERIRYHQMMEYILGITDITQIFTLNNKLFVQIEDNVKLFGNKNISDTERLFEIVKEELIRKKEVILSLSKILQLIRENYYILY